MPISCDRIVTLDVRCVDNYSLPRRHNSGDDGPADPLTSLGRRRRARTRSLARDAMKLLIYCAGSFGREISDTARRMNDCARKWDEIVFVDDNAGLGRECHGSRLFTLPALLDQIDPEGLRGGRRERRACHKGSHQ